LEEKLSAGITRSIAMSSYYNGVWIVLLAVLTTGCPFEGTTKFLADTTNYTHETIHSITVSTSGETLMDGQLLTDELRVKIFVHDSFESLQQDMARGSGEYLTSFAQLAKIPPVRRPAFFAHAMEQYAVRIRTGNMTPEQLRVAVLSDWKSD
jgi:hypothetical protein